MKYILFDLDGTLTDPAVGILSGVRYALDYFGIEYGDDESLFCYIGPPLRESFRDYAGLSENDAEIAVKKYREYYSVTGVKQNKLYDGVTRMLEELKSKGFVLSLATSKPTAFAKVIEDRKAGIEAMEGFYDAQHMVKVNEYFAKIDEWYAGSSFTGVTNLLTFKEITTMPPASSIPAIREKYQAELDKYNDLYVFE